MRSTFISISFLLLGRLLYAQPIEELIQTEKNFAAWSVSYSTKEAFLKFLDSSGVVFDNGKAVNGIEFWSMREKRPGILNWQPRYAEIAPSGDLGYTTGPWTFKKSENDTVLARGLYTTIWHTTKTGEWKFLVDLGVNDTPEDNDSCWRIERTFTDTICKGSLRSLLKAEKSFIRHTSKSVRGWPRKEWYMRSFSGTGYSILSRNHRLYAMDTDPYLDVMNEMPEKIKYHIIGSGIASSGNLGYVFGITKINGKTDNYLRIWHNEVWGWKLILEVLRY